MPWRLQACTLLLIGMITVDWHYPVPHASLSTLDYIVADAPYFSIPHLPLEQAYHLLQPPIQPFIGADHRRRSTAAALA